MRKFLTLFLSLVCFSAFADDNQPVPPQPRVSLFSTTVDWEAVTGLSLHQFTGHISGTSRLLVKEGLMLYYLDAFPCYGEADSVRVWLSPNGKMDGKLRLVCIQKPEKISFAWRNADKDASDAVTEGILNCKIEGKKRDFTIDISKCEQGKKWKDK